MNINRKSLETKNTTAPKLISTNLAPVNKNASPTTINTIPIYGAIAYCNFYKFSST